jgi:phenylacetate-CoA ligase
MLESVLMPAYYGLRGRRYTRARDFLERSQWWFPEQLRDFQWNELCRLLEHAFRSVPYYQRKYREAGVELGDIKTREDFAKLPTLHREEINQHRNELCAQDFKGDLIEHATGGSSGIPTRFYITRESYDWRCAASARAYSWSGYQTGEPALYLWGAPVGPVSRLKTAKLKSYHLVRRELIVPTFVQTPELWQRTYEAALHFRPRFVVGYVSSLQEFAQYLLSRELLISGVDAVLSAAEAVHGPSREAAERAFHAPMFETYGSREFMSIAAECEFHSGLHVHADNLLIETDRSINGEPSEFLITDLHNFGMPFIRYRIGDVGVLSDRTCGCGRGLPLIRKVEGRVLEVLRTQDGRTVPGEFFPHLLKDVPEVREFQVRQQSLEEVVISLVLASALSAKSENLLRSEIGKVFTSATRVIIKHVDSIPQGRSGKRRLTIGMGQTA